jgi:hypothetical protein
MAKKPKSNDLEVAPEHPSEQQIRKAAKAALKKADRFWRLAEKAPSVLPVPAAASTKNVWPNRLGFGAAPPHPADRSPQFPHR